MSTALIASRPGDSHHQLRDLIEGLRLFSEVRAIPYGDIGEALAEEEVDIVFTAWQPATAGEVEKLTGLLRSRDPWIDIPLIVFCAGAWQTVGLQVIRGGASDCFPLEMDCDELTVRLQPHLCQKARIDELRRENSRLAQLAIVDPATDLFNRTYFDLMLEFEAARCQRQGTVLSLLALAIDRLETISGYYGPRTGDSLLSLVAEVIQATTRQSDIPCRFSHGEFAVILPDTSAPGASVLGERIRSKIARCGPNPPLNAFETTVSIGISGKRLTMPGESLKLVEEAFCALQNGQLKGMNRMEIFCQGLPELAPENRLADSDHSRGSA